MLLFNAIASELTSTSVNEVAGDMNGVLVVGTVRLSSCLALLDA